MIEKKFNSGKKGGEMTPTEREEAIDRLVSNCRYDGVVISEATISALIESNAPIIEVGGFLYLPIADVREKKGPKH